jgi:nucleotide-binding universal stress UspA family protein
MADINITRVLFPCDLTKSAEIVMPYVKSLVEQYGAVLVVLHVIPDIHDWKALLTPVPSLTMYYEHVHEHAEKELETFTRKHIPPHVNYEKILLAGDPVEKILYTIDREGIDLVIMGTHGTKGLEDRIFGGVAENVVKKSPVPVMVVNPHKLSQ